MSYPIDQPVRLTFHTYSDAARSTLADPTTVTLDVRSPDGTVSTVTWAGAQVVRDSLGVFHYDVTPTAAGHYSYHWKAAGAVATSFDGAFDVEAEYGTTWLALADVRAELNFDDTDTSADDEVRVFTAAATEVIDNIVGPVGPVTYTETYDGGGPVIVLRHYPVLSVTSITEYSAGVGQVLAAEPFGTSPYTGYGYQLNADSGLITRTSGGSPYRFASNVVIVYRAGRATVPAAVRLAALELVRHMWETQRGDAAGRPVPGYDAETPQTFGAGYLVPNRVSELLEPYRKAPTVA